MDGIARGRVIGEYRYQRGDRWTYVMVLPVEVGREHAEWPEHERKRMWCDAETAAQLVASERLSALIRQFSPDARF